MKTLVLGGCGFIGSHLTDRLLLAGHEVRVLDHSPEKFRDALPEVDYRIADFGDEEALADALDQVELVYHLVSTTVPSTSNRDPEADVRENLVHSLRMLQMLVGKPMPRVVFISSGGTVYGIPEALPVSEEHRIAPICSHAVVKVAIENYLQMYAYLHGLEYVVLRVSNPYGERQGHFGVQGVIGTFLELLRQGKPIEVWGDGSVVRDFLSIDDLADLCVRAGESSASGIYNAGSGEGHSISQLIEIMQAVIGRQVDVSFRESRALDVPRIYLDISKARQEFGWSPSIGLEEGIRRLWTSH